MTMHTLGMLFLRAGLMLAAWIAVTALVQP